MPKLVICLPFYGRKEGLSSCGWRMVRHALSAPKEPQESVDLGTGFGVDVSRTSVSMQTWYLTNHHPWELEMELVLKELTADDFPVVSGWIDPGVFKVFSSPVDDHQLMRLLSVHEDGIQTDIGMKAVDNATGDTVGIIHAVIDGAGSYIHLQQIVVDPAMRNQGIGTAMIRLFLNICFQDHAVGRVQLLTDAENHAAISCYNRASFQREESQYQGEYLFSILRERWEGLSEV